MNSAGQGRSRFAVSELPVQFGVEDFSDVLLNFRIIAAQISVRHNCHCRNLDVELIDFVKRHEKLRHLI
jgi:hypothetical protein